MLIEPIYRLRPVDVFSALETTSEGLKPSQVAEREVLYGKNILTVETPEPFWKSLFHHVAHPLAILLWLAGGITLVSGEWVLTVVIWGLVLVNAGFSFWRESRAIKSIQELQNLMPSNARVLRNRSETSILSIEIIPGDILILAEGDQIPADARVVEAYGLRINNAALTGESVPVLKTADASLGEGMGELERPNLVFAGTSVFSGTGKAIVYATGMLTQFGRITRLTQSVVESPSRLQTELTTMSRRIAWISACIAVLVWIISATDMQLGMQEAFLLALGVLAALTPEGLPANLTLALASAGRRLAKQGILVKKLSTIETLGTISTICTDKSGTLTQNQMTVQEITTTQNEYLVSGIGYNPQGTIEPLEKHLPLPADLSLLLIAAISCNNSRLTPPSPSNPTWTSLGDQTEAAMRVVGMKGGVEDKVLQNILPRIYEIPFDAHRKRMSTVHRFQSRSSYPPALENGIRIIESASTQEICFVKGAPREMLQQCTHILHKNDIRPLISTDMQALFTQIDQKARRALRVLALAYRPLPPRDGIYRTEIIESQLIFLGFMAMMDPPRPEIAQAISSFKQTGIHIIMVTGDYGLTAESVARRLNMLSTPSPKIINGIDIEEMDDEQIQQILTEDVIYARMAPEHKLRLVAALQKRGDVVAVIGDGVNDAPALRKADLGFCMGLSGTGVAKDAADIILVNDDFSAIVPSIVEGRTIYRNLRKLITYILSSNVAEIAPVFLAIFLNLPLLLNVRQILAIDLLTEMLPSLALGTEKPEPDMMRSHPFRKEQPLLDRSVFKKAFLWLGPLETLIALYGAFLFCTSCMILLPRHLNFLSMLKWNFDPFTHYPKITDASTVYFAGVVLAQVGNAFACRTEGKRNLSFNWLTNRFLWISIGISLIVVIGLVNIPFLANLFGNTPLPIPVWLLLMIYPIFIISMEWLRKQIISMRKKRRI